MAILEAVLATNGFVDGADKMVDALTRLFGALDHAYRGMQKFEITMSSFSGTMTQSKSDLETLLQKSNLLGVSFEEAATPFAKFASAATDLSRNQVFEVFNSFATALSAVRANGNEVNGVFLALQQIVSKGKVSMEELRLQLAERLPRAMPLAAEAMKMSMGEFEEAVRKGTINSTDFIIKFAAKLKEHFGPAALLGMQSFDAEVNRLSNSWFKFRADLVESSGSADIWATILSDLNNMVLQNTDTFGSLGKILQDLSLIARDLFGVTLVAAEPLLSLLSGAVSLLARGVAFVTGTFYTFAAAIAAVSSVAAEGVLNLGTYFGLIDEGSETFTKMQNFANNASTAALGYLNNAGEAFTRMKEPFDTVKQKVTEVNQVIEHMAGSTIANAVKSLEELAKKTGELLAQDLKDYEKKNKEQEQIIEEMYKEAGLSADAYYDQEATNLVQKVSKWQAAGADIEKSNAYLYTKLGELSAKAYAEGNYIAGLAVDNYQNMSRTLVDQFNTTQQTINDWVAQVAANVKGVDGSKINIVASLDGGAVVQGIDDLMYKFAQLQAAAAAAQQRSVTYNAETDGSWDSFYNSQEKAGNTGSSGSSSYKRAVGPSITNNFNQNVSRSDVTNILRMQVLQGSRQ